MSASPPGFLRTVGRRLVWRSFTGGARRSDLVAATAPITRYVLEGLGFGLAEKVISSSLGSWMLYPASAAGGALLFLIELGRLRQHYGPSPRGELYRPLSGTYADTSGRAIIRWDW